MKRKRVVAILLVLCIPLGAPWVAEAAPSTPAGSAASSPIGEPEVAAWLGKILRGYGLSPDEFDEGAGQDEPGPAKAPPDLVRLHPLGDVNEDAFGDLLRERVRYGATDEDWAQWLFGPFMPVETVLELASGPNFDAGWSLQLEGLTLWRFFGDVDKDGVADISVASLEGFGEGRADESNSFELEQVVFSTRTGQRLFAHTSRFAQESHEVSPLEYEDVFSSVTLEPSLLPGVAAEEIEEVQRTNWRSAGSYMAVEYSSVHHSTSFTWKALGVGGKPMRSATAGFPHQLATLLDRSDYTGDGAPDALFGSLPWGGNSTSLRTAAGVRDLSEASARTVLLDGARGGVAWAKDTGLFRGDGFAAPAGLNALGGRDVLLGYYGSTAATSYEQRETRVSVLRGPDGAAGSERVVPGIRHAAIGFSDLDGDGTDEWFFEGLGGSGVARRDDSVVWLSSDYFPSLSEYWEDPAYTLDWIRAMRDVNGDNVPDRLEDDFGREDSPPRRFLRSGASGQPLWFDEYRPGLLYFDSVPGLAGPDGEGIVEVRVDLPATADKPAPRNQAVNLANHTISLTLRSGMANEPRWSAALHAPNWSRAPLFATQLNVEADTTADTTHDGSPDIVVFVQSPDCGSEWSDCPSGPALAFSHTYVLDGASGRLVVQVPASPAPEPSSTAPAAATEASVAPEQDVNASPAIGILSGCAAMLAVGLGLARRR